MTLLNHDIATRAADTCNRDLKSYVAGHYMAERNTATGASRLVGMREGHHSSVVLGIFANVDFATTFTLASDLSGPDLLDHRTVPTRALLCGRRVTTFDSSGKSSH
jgi:hypothetical protein